MTSTAPSLPPDVVREILKYFAAPFHLPMNRHHRHSAGFPWYLSHVCAPWRGVFLSMSKEFWSKYLLEPEDSTQSNSEETWFAQTKYFLQHNSGTPFSIEIRSFIPCSSNNVLEALVAASERWQDASLSITVEQLPILFRIQGALPHLRSFILNVEGNMPASAIPGACEGTFENAPLLKRVELPFLSTWRICWSSLTALRLTKKNHGLLEILPYMRDLEELGIPCPESPWTSSPIDPKISISLPRLKILSVAELSFLSILETPVLRKLYINLERYSPEWSTLPSMLGSFFGKSTSQLEHLTLKDSIPIATAVVLPYTPNITSLEIGHDGHTGSRDHFGILTCSSMEPGLVLVRQMESLTVIISSPLSMASSPITKLIKSRTTERPANMRPLRRLELLLTDLSWESFRSMDIVKSLCADCDVQLHIGEAPKVMSRISIPAGISFPL